MRRLLAAVAICCVVALFGLVLKRARDARGLSGAYLGQQPPGRTPVLFAPGVVSRAFDERMAFFTPDGKELFFQLRGAPFSVIVWMKEGADGWSEPSVAPFSGRYFAEFGLSPDGNTVILTSRQPLDGLGAPSDTFHTWMVNRTKDGWSAPRYLGPRLDGIGYPTMADSGNLYFFCYHRKGGHGLGDLWMAERTEAGYREPINLGPTVNSERYDVDPFVAPDESYVIFTSDRPGGCGEGDLYVTFRDQAGAWSAPVNMGSTINTATTEFCASVTPDGKYLFFTSGRTSHQPWASTPMTFAEKMRILQSPGNGSNDIYWVDASIIEDLREPSAPAPGP